MAEMFCFNSPVKPTLPGISCSVCLGKAKVNKRRRTGKMDFISQHACVARFDEPTFCSNDIPFLLAQYQSRSSPLDGEAPRNHDVPYRRDIVDNRMANAESATPECESGPSMLTQHLPTQRSSVLCSGHPRPLGRESWAEEDGRRVRFALDGTDTNDVAQFLQPAEESAVLPTMTAEAVPQERIGNMPEARGNVRTPLATSPVENDDTTTPASVRPMQPSTPPPPPPVLMIEDPDNMPETHLSLWRSQHGAMSIHHGMAADEDWLPVDDARRNYDVTEFLQDWRLRSMATGLPIAFDSESGRPGRFSHPPHEVCRKQTTTAAMDMQGIPWRLMGRTREDALAARVLLHPARRSLKAQHLGKHSRSDSCALVEESGYRFRNFTPYHRAQYSHYQLRNLLVACGRSDIFYANRGKVHRTSLSVPLSSDLVMDLVKPSHSIAGFRITCLATSKRNDFPLYQSDDVLLAGGFEGEYAMLDLNSRKSYTDGFLTHAENGIATHIHTFKARRSGLLQAAFCSNDHKLRLLDTRTQRVTDTFTYAYPINCSATSADGRLRALVGDDNDTLIINAEKGETVVTLKGHQDHGFACAWAENGIHVATGAQDGQTLVWDARNWSQPLRSLPSIMTCPRSVHFTDDGALVVAESEDVVSIYDPTSFDKRQDIRFFGSIAGVTLLNGGAEIVIANTDKTVGGLLSFERTAEGFTQSSFGKRGGRARRTRSNVRMTDYTGLFPAGLV